MPLFARRRFPPGLRLPSHKDEASRQPLRVASSPALAIVALDQGSGAGARPAVNVGERVRLGTCIGHAHDPTATPVYAPVAGIVRAVEIRDTAGPAGSGPCVVIENDGSDEAEREFMPVEWRTLEPEELIDALRLAGIAGLGGAAFPTAVKLAGAKSRAATHLVLNGAECEPWICCDDALLRERASDVVLGAQVMLRACGASRCTIAIEDDKPQAIAAVQAAVEVAADPRIEVLALGTVYPAGAERQLLATATGIEVPYDALPPAAGLLCQNVGTSAAVATFVRTGAPLTSRIVTVSGSGVRHPANLEARIGTPVADLVGACGGYVANPERLIAGGIMTGRALGTDEVPLTQAVNCILAATGADLTAREGPFPCIRCGDCADVCPVGLLPQQLHRGVLAADAAILQRHGIDDCIECGCCDYVCPSGIALTAGFRSARAEARRQHEAGRRADEARERYARHERRLAAAAEEERNAFEAARRRARGENVERSE
jgi:Na+-translocating ferredoxin:NAD+ oxidoreductase subunit C